jgi:hypothetical protein
LQQTYLPPEGFKALEGNSMKMMLNPSDRQLAAEERRGEAEHKPLKITKDIETFLAVKEATGQVC